jgi:basic amino acid/polyamine antiporter, APA family
MSGRSATVAPVSAAESPPEARLRRVLGLWELTASGVGIIIGAGIYVLVGAATAEAGSAVWLAFVLAAVLSALTALSYVELASMFPRASSEYEFTSHVAPPWVAFVVGWTMTAGLVVAAATVSLGFARYARHFVAIDSRVGAVVLVLLVGVIAATGIKQSARLTIALSAVQVGGLLLVIAIGIPHVGDHDLLVRPELGGLLGGAALVFFAFIGFDEVITLSEETRNPTRTVPRALLLALGISTVLYIAVAVAAVSVLGASALGASERPLADVMGRVIGDRSAATVAAIALIATTNTTLLALTAASRMLYGMASQGALPAWLAAVHRRRQTPVRAIVLVGAVAAGFALIGDLTLVASVTDFAIYLMFLVVNATVIVLRLREPDRPRPSRVPWCAGRVPVPPVLGIATVLVMLTQLDVQAIVLGTLVTLAGLAVAAALKSARNPNGGAPSTGERRKPEEVGAG